jgi:hypothetical protein
LRLLLLKVVGLRVLHHGRGSGGFERSSSSSSRSQETSVVRAGVGVGNVGGIGRGLLKGGRSMMLQVLLLMGGREIGVAVALGSESGSLRARFEDPRRRSGRGEVAVVVVQVVVGFEATSEMRGRRLGVRGEAARDRTTDMERGCFGSSLSVDGSEVRVPFDRSEA